MTSAARYYDPKTHLNDANMYIGINPWPRSIKEGQEETDFNKQLSRLLRPTTKKKTYKLEDGEYVNTFTVHLTQEGEATRVDIKSQRKANEKEEKINHLTTKLKEAVAAGNMGQVIGIATEIELTKA